MTCFLMKTSKPPHHHNFSYWRRWLACPPASSIAQMLHTAAYIRFSAHARVLHTQNALPGGKTRYLRVRNIFTAENAAWSMRQTRVMPTKAAHKKKERTDVCRPQETMTALPGCCAVCQTQSACHELFVYIVWREKSSCSRHTKHPSFLGARTSRIGLVRSFVKSFN